MGSPRRALSPNDSFGGGGPKKDEGSAAPRGSLSKDSEINEKNLLSQKKELWIFWYGDKPESLFKKVVKNPKLKEIPDISGLASKSNFFLFFVLFSILLCL